MAVQTNVPARVADFRELMRLYTEVRGLTERGVPAPNARRYLDRYAASCTDSFIQQVAYEWATRLPSLPPAPPGTHVLSDVLSIEEWALATIQTQAMTGERLETAESACRQIRSLIGQARVDRIYADMLCASVSSAAQSPTEQTAASWWV